MNASSARPHVRIHSAAGLLAVIPHLLGFTPGNSLVVVGVAPEGRVRGAFRYDLPDPPNASTAAEIAGHALGILVQHNLPVAAVAGYGPGARITPLADAFRAAAPNVGVRLHDVLRVEDGRYWSYLCTNPDCCAPEGVVFDPAADPATQALAAVGLRVLPSREALAATIAPVTGAAAEAMHEATQEAEQAAARLVARSGVRALDRRGLGAVQVAIGTYFDGKCIHRDSDYAWLGLALKRLRVRDSAWTRMNPSDRDIYQELWTDVVRHVQPGYAAAPASLLAFAAWQGGDGALANLALDRAMADQPDYSLALLLRDALDAGTPPSAAVPPMTPKEVADSYTTPPQTSAESSQSSSADKPRLDGDDAPDAASAT